MRWEPGQEDKLGRCCGWTCLWEDGGWAWGEEALVRKGHLRAHFKTQNWGRRALARDDSRPLGLMSKSGGWFTEVEKAAGGAGVPGLCTAQFV